jgi:glucose-6-phosphate isomerase
LQTRIKKIDLKNALFIVVSKSGTTVETISIFKYLHTLTTIDKNNCVVISEDDSKLSNYAKKHNIKIFHIPKNVGGRFSVFSVVGLLPLAIVGVDIENLLNGAKDIYHSFFEQDEYYDILMQKARFLVENKNRFNINVIFSYSTLLEGFNKWYIQLWGESLGKFNINKTRQALTPIALLGPVDQHSFLQLIIDGKRDKTITFIKIDDFESELTIPNISLEYLDELDYLNNIKFKDIINYQADATIKAIDELKDIPYDIITIKTVNEYNIAKLMFSFELLTSIVGKFVQINTYDQPGVEAGKVILKNRLKGLL